MRSASLSHSDDVSVEARRFMEPVDDSEGASGVEGVCKAPTNGDHVIKAGGVAGDVVVNGVVVGPCDGGTHSD